MNVLCLYNIPSPYRVQFCNELSGHVSLDVIYERKKASDRNKKWESSASTAYNIIYLEGIKIGAEQALSFNIIKFLRKNTYDIIVIGGYSTPTSMLAIIYMKLKKIPFLLNADGAFIKPDSRLKRFIKRFFIKSARAWLSTSDNTSRYFEHYGAKNERIYKYPFSSIMQTDIKEKRPTESEKKRMKSDLGIDENKIILSIGQFIERKGFDVLLKS